MTDIHKGKYSQYGEDNAIAAHTPETGRFLDIGAWNAITFSNTRLLFERGWSGVLVEPSPGPFAGLQDAYKNEARIQLVQACVGFDRHPIAIYITEDATSTTDPETYEKWRGVVAYTGAIYVPQVLLEDLYQTGPFDFVNIDAEGTSVDLFQRLMDLGHRPQCVCVEHDNRVVELAQRATECEYSVVYSNGTNMVLAR